MACALQMMRCKHSFGKPYDYFKHSVRAAVHVAMLFVQISVLSNTVFLPGFVYFS